MYAKANSQFSYLAKVSSFKAQKAFNTFSIDKKAILEHRRRTLLETENNRASDSASRLDDQASITNDRKNILEKISKNILSSHGLQIDPNLSRNFEMKMSEVKKNRSLRVNPGTNDKNSQCLIRMNSSFRIRWDLIVMLCAIWN